MTQSIGDTWLQSEGPGGRRLAGSARRTSAHTVPLMAACRQDTSQHPPKKWPCVVPSKAATSRGLGSQGAAWGVAPAVSPPPQAKPQCGLGCSVYCGPTGRCGQAGGLSQCLWHHALPGARALQQRDVGRGPCGVWASVRTYMRVGGAGPSLGSRQVAGPARGGGGTAGLGKEGAQQGLERPPRCVTRRWGGHPPAGAVAQETGRPRGRETRGCRQTGSWGSSGAAAAAPFPGASSPLAAEGP